MMLTNSKCVLICTACEPSWSFLRYAYILMLTTVGDGPNSKRTGKTDLADLELLLAQKVDPWPQWPSSQSHYLQRPHCRSCHLAIPHCWDHIRQSIGDILWCSSCPHHINGLCQSCAPQRPQDPFALPRGLHLNYQVCIFGASKGEECFMHFLTSRQDTIMSTINLSQNDR